MTAICKKAIKCGKRSIVPQETCQAIYVQEGASVSVYVDNKRIGILPRNLYLKHFTIKED